MQRFVGGIGHQESKRLYEKCASSPDFINDFLCLLKRFFFLLFIYSLIYLFEQLQRIQLELHYSNRRKKKRKREKSLRSTYLRITIYTLHTSDSTQCLAITFQSFANRIKVSNRTAASEFYAEFLYLC